MPPSIVECIPNFSEARRPEVVRAIADAISSVAEITVLDLHSDQDHNRTVITFVGPPGQVEAAAFEGIAKAAELIDLNKHTGEHPRLGAADVVPFVPISGVTMEACVEMARRLGARVGEELQIPVYLYEEAAARPERQSLENIRRGQYEALKDELGTNPDREPDYGPTRVGPAGATVIGARQPLIAFNVYLNSGDASIAKKIAKTVRHSSGGLRYVKALGLLVEGQAQVSMNLTNFRSTPLAQVVEMIRREAVRHGTSVHHSELVGLIPQEALVDSARWYLQLDQFEPEQILEQRLAAEKSAAPETAAAPPAGDFLDALAANTPTPGGGSAAAYSGAAGAALVAMVARLTIGRKKYVEVDEKMRTILDQAEGLRRDLSAAVEQDAAAFTALMTAFRLPKDSQQAVTERAEAIEAATYHAAEVPLEVARMAVEVIGLALQAVSMGNINAISDGASGAALAKAALTCAGYNVRINVKDLQDQSGAQLLLQNLHELEGRAMALEERLHIELKSRGGMPPA